jgi:UDP-glucose:(heptosyl)LPS alpha-1,3-glucosyltransferase
VGTTIAPGIVDDSHPVHHRVVRPRSAPVALQPFAFRRAAARVVAELPPCITLSCGVEAPPGDVLWVHSVHAAWLDRGSPAMVGGRVVPAWARQLLPRHRVTLALERTYFSATEARTIICTSNQEVDDLEQFYGVSRELSHVVPNGFDPAVFNPVRRVDLRAESRRRLGMSPEEVSVLLVANEWHRKGLGPLLNAVASVSDPRLRIDLVGRLAPSAYAELASHLGLGDRMHWHGSASDVAPFYAAADIFALPTTYEPFGIVIVEAMAMGLPVVVPVLAGASAAIHPGEDGLLLEDPRDSQELANALRRLMEPDERRRIGDAAAGAVSHLTWDQVLTRADALVSRTTIKG